MTPDWAAKPTDVPYANFGNPQSLNLYAYVENNPTTTGDPDGHSDAGTFCSSECRARYAQYAAEHPVAATFEPIAEFGTIPTGENRRKPGTDGTFTTFTRTKAGGPGF
jgi:hypothetical protein